MIIDPQLAVLRSQAPLDFYDRVTARINRRPVPPRGIALHLAGSFGGELRVISVYRDRASMSESFAAYTAPESSNEMIESGETYDITRDEFELQRLEIPDSVPRSSLMFNKSDPIVAISSELIAYTPEEYREFTASAGWYDAEVAGRLGHLAYETGGQSHAFDIWASREQADEWYRSIGLAQFDDHFPGRRTDEIYEASWIDVRGFAVLAEIDDPIRHFNRADG
ncbi:MAG: hypothetical protein QM648_08400 [Solirubrobacterales bacterium]